MGPLVPSSNPLALLSFFVAPAVLTNASCILTLATSNRFARAMDRTRALMALLEKPEGSDPDRTALWTRLVASAQSRAVYLVRALNAYYLAIAAFGSASLAALIGAAFPFSAPLRDLCFAVAFCAGTAGVGALIYASALLFFESRLTLQIVQEERRHMMQSLRRAP